MADLPADLFNGVFVYAFLFVILGALMFVQYWLLPKFIGWVGKL